MTSYTTIDLPPIDPGCLAFLNDEDDDGCVNASDVVPVLPPPPPPPGPGPGPTKADEDVAVSPVPTFPSKKSFPPSQGLPVKRSPFSAVKSMSPRCDKKDYKKPALRSVLSNLPTIDLNIVPSSPSQPHSPSVKRSPATVVVAPPPDSSKAKNFKQHVPSKLAKVATTFTASSSDRVPKTVPKQASKIKSKNYPSVDISLFFLKEAGFTPYRVIMVPQDDGDTSFIILCYTKFMEEFAVLINEEVDLLARIDPALTEKYTDGDDPKTFLSGVDTSKYNVISSKVKQLFTSIDTKNLNCENMARIIGSTFNNYGKFMWKNVIGAIVYTSDNTYLRVTVNPQNINNENLSPNTRKKGAPEFFLYSKTVDKPITNDIISGLCPILSSECFYSSGAAHEALAEIRKCHSESIRTLATNMTQRIQAKVKDVFFTQFSKKTEDVYKAIRRSGIESNERLNSIQRGNAPPFGSAVASTHSVKRACFDYYEAVMNKINELSADFEESISREMARLYVEYKITLPPLADDASNMSVDSDSLEFPEMWGLDVGSEDVSIDLTEKPKAGDTLDLKNIKIMFNKN